MNKHLTIKSLNTHNRIYISTANSVYTFTLLDAQMQRGLLTGGALGTQEVEAYAVSVTDAHHGQVARRLSKSIAGLQIIFLVFIGRVPEYLITSVVTRLTCYGDPEMAGASSVKTSDALNEYQQLA